MLRDVSDFDAETFAFGQGAEHAATTAVDVQTGPSGATATITDAHLLFNSDFVRAGNDLILRGHDGGSALVRDYFASDHRPTLMSRDGAKLSGDLIDALSGSVAPGQYAQAGTPAPAASDAVGRVVTASGDASIIRNGVAVTLKAGDPVLRADVLQTQSGTMAVTFNDGSTLNLTANTRIVVSEFVYSPNGAGNSQLLNLVQGSLTFISGEVAHSGNMRIGTPVATMGIRGTVGGVTTANDGTVHFYVSQSATGAVIINEQGQIIANVVQDGPMIVVRPAGPLQVIAEEVQKSPAQLALELQALQQIVSIKAIGDQLLQQFFQQQNPNNPNPQSPQNGPHTQIQIDLHTNPNNTNGDDPPPAGDNRPFDQAAVHLPSTDPNDTRPPTPIVDLLHTNLPPVTFAPTIASVKEDQALTFSGPKAIALFDADSTALTVTLTVTHGMLHLAGIAGLTFSVGNGADAATMTFSGTQAAINAALNGMIFKPAADYNGAAALTITTQDEGSHPITTSVPIAVTAVNDAPVLSPSAPSSTLTAADTNGAGMTVAALLAGHVTDADAGAVAGIAVTGAAASYGTWQYSLDNGAHWLNFASYSNGSALLLAASDLVRFVPDGHTGGTDTLTYLAWDQTSGNHGDTVAIAEQGGSSSFSTASDTLTVTVTGDNHAPTFDAASYGFTVQENAAYGTVVGTVHASDQDNDALTYSITSGDDNHLFSVDSHGAIIVAGLLDYESATARDIVVTATDIYGATTHTAVHVGIQNVSEPASTTLTSTEGTSVAVSQYGATSGFQFAGGGNVTTPGTPEDRIVLGFDLNGHNYVVNESPLMNDVGMTPVATSSYTHGGVNYFSTVLSAGHGVTVTQTVGLGADANYFTTDIDIFNGSGSDLSNVRFMRNLDPDQDRDIPNGTYDTYNDVLQNPTQSRALAAVQAIGPITGAAVALIADGGNWRASAFGFTNTDPYAAAAFDSPQDPNGARADIAIALTNDVGAIANGAAAHLSFITTANVATAGANALIGTAGGDTIDGLGGNDLLFGLDGADTFVFHAGSGNDTVMDFVHGTDVLQFDSDVFASAQAVIDAITTVGGEAVIQHGADSVTLHGVSAATLTTSDIHIHSIV